MGGKKLEGRGDEVETWHFSKRQGINSANFCRILQKYSNLVLKMKWIIINYNGL